MAVVLALAAAASWGSADFLGGLAGRRAGADRDAAITFWSQLAGLAGVAVAAFLVPAASPATSDLVWGAIAGAGGGIGVALLYRGLTVGRMSVVAPVTAAGASIVPVLYGLVVGEIPTLAASIGVVVTAVAIVLVSRAPDPDAGAATGLPPGLVEAVIAGLGFALVFIALDRTDDATGLWPLLPMKVASTGAAVVLGLALRRPLGLPAGEAPTLVAVGALDAAAITAYLLATRAGLLPVVAVLGSLYPVGTVLLARIVLSERITANQLGGLALAAVGVALIALG